MSPIELRDSTTGSTVRIAPQLGFNCFDFVARVHDWSIRVLEADPAFETGSLRSSGHGIPVLFPFPNRIRDSRFEWAGRQFQIPADVGLHDKNGHSIHGFCLDKPWRVIAQTERSCVGQFQLSVDAPDRRPLWPADFMIEIRYEIRGTTLRADIKIQNPDSVPLPWGFGTHPYFRLPLDPQSSISQCLVQVPAASEWVLEDCLPSGERRAVPESKDLRDGEYLDVLKLDDVLTDLEPSSPVGSPVVFETAIFDESAGLQITQRFGSGFRECVVFTPPNRPCICIEPYTCVTDAVHLQAQEIDAGWNVLAPGEVVHLWFDITAGTLMC